MSEDVHTDGEVLMDVTNSYEIVQGASYRFAMFLIRHAVFDAV